MPQKTWAIGEEVLATDFNTYVQNQIVARFATAAARDAAWPAATAGPGAMSVTTDNGTLWTVVGSAWVVVDTAGGGVIVTNASTNVPNSTAAAIGPWVDVSDPDGWNPGGGTTLSVPAGRGGRYLVALSVTWSVVNLGTTSGVAVAFGGTDYASTVGPGSPFQVYGLTTAKTLAAGDGIYFRAWQSSGVTVSMSARLEIMPV